MASKPLNSLNFGSGDTYKVPNPTAKTEQMTQPVGVDSDGKLYTDQNGNSEIIDIENPVYDEVASHVNTHKVGNSVVITNEYPGRDTYFHLNLGRPLYKGRRYILSFDAEGVDDSNAPSFAVETTSGGSRFTIHNGANVVPFTVISDVIDGRIIIDDWGTRPTGINVKLDNFSIQPDELYQVTRAYTDKLAYGDWDIVTINGDYYVGSRKKTTESLQKDTSYSGIYVSEPIHIRLPFPTRLLNVTGSSCQTDGTIGSQYIGDVSEYENGDAIIGVDCRVFDPLNSNITSFKPTIQSAGIIVAPPAKPTIVYDRNGAEEAVGIAQTYVNAQLGGRTFKYGVNFFHGTNEKVNDENGNGMVECDTYMGLVMRGIPYDLSPYSNTTPNYQYSYTNLMGNANPNNYEWCARLLPYIQDKRYLRHDVIYAADLAWMFWGISGSIFGNIYYARTGDIALWKEPFKNGAFDNVGHCAMLVFIDRNGDIVYGDNSSRPDSEPWVYEVTGESGSGGKVLQKIKLSEKALQPTYFARPDYS